MSTYSKKTIEVSEWVSQAEAARLRGVSRQAIWKLIRNGRIRSLEIGGHVLVSRVDVKNFQPREAGRPRMNDGQK
jgi:excisionase family DNA binding protein